MSFEDAVSALESAQEADSAASPLPSPTPAVPEQAVTPVPATPEGETSPTPVQPHHAQQQPRDPASGKFIRPDGTLSDTPEPVADTFDGGQFNPDTLPPELQPGWRQLQAAFTRKTQDLALERQQFEGLDPAVAREAVELYTALQDPTYLQQFHSELTTALQAQGLTPAQASAEAARQLDGATEQPQGTVTDQLAALKNDPELAPVAEAFTQLRQELDAMKTASENERAAQEQAHLQMALAGELVRQETILKENGFTTKDIDRVHELAAFHDGNLLSAAQSYNAMRQEVLEEYLGNKQAVVPGVAPVPGASTSEIPVVPQDLDEGLKAALGFIQSAGLDTLE